MQEGECQSMGSSKIAELKLRKIKRLSDDQIKYLWKVHGEKKGAKNNHLRAGLLGKIVGIEWVLNTLNSMDFMAEEKEKL